MTATPGPIINSENARPGLRRYGLCSDHSQQCCAADRHCEPLRQARSGVTARSQSDVPLHITEPGRPAGPRHRGIPEAFREDGSRTGRVRTSESPCYHPELDDTPLPGQIHQTPVVMTMNAPGHLFAQRARSYFRSRLGYQYDPVGAGQNLAHDELVRNERQYGCCQGMLNRRGSWNRPL